MIGWLPLEFLSHEDGVNNPREEFIQAHNENKLGMLHLIQDDRHSVCGNAIILTGLYDNTNQSNAINDPDDIPLERRSYVNYIVCKECYASRARDS